MKPSRTHLNPSPPPRNPRRTPSRASRFLPGQEVVLVSERGYFPKDAFLYCGQPVDPTDVYRIIDCPDGVLVDAVSLLHDTRIFLREGDIRPVPLRWMDGQRREVTAADISVAKAGVTTTPSKESLGGTLEELERDSRIARWAQVAAVLAIIATTIAVIYTNLV